MGPNKTPTIVKLLLVRAGAEVTVCEHESWHNGRRKIVIQVLLIHEGKLEQQQLFHVLEGVG